MKISKIRRKKYLKYINNKYKKNLKRLRKMKKILSNNNKILNADTKIKNCDIFKNNKLLSFLQSKEKFYKKANKKNQKIAIIEVPEVFSLSENVEESLKLIKNVYMLTYSKGLEKIIIDHTKCQKIDVAASTLMDIIIMNLKVELEKRKKGIRLSGNLPTGNTDRDKKVREILSISGIKRHLLNYEYYNSLDVVKSMDWFGGGKDYNSNITKIKKVGIGEASTKIVDYFNECLKTQGAELEKKGKQKLGLITGEVIDNCELHCGNFSQWYSLGHYSKLGTNYGECQIVIFNFGQTIYEGLKNSASDETKKSLKDITKVHTPFFKITSNWDEEMLWTLYSLQDGVSRCRNEKIEKEKDRGTGTIKLITSFQEIGETLDGQKSTMTIISGSTMIKVDDKYKMKKVDDRDVIAFNKDNDLYKVPDKNNVIKLNSYFPGTIISMKIFLDEEYLKKIIERSGEENER